MKKLIIPITCLLLISCNNKNKSISEDEQKFDYTDVSERSIKWEQLFEPKDKFYYAYIYSTTCPHCNDIKQEVIYKSINNEESIYFIEYTKDIPVGTNINDYIGQSNYINVGLIGVPTLMEISDHVITNIFVGSKEIIKTLYKCIEE